MIVVITMFDGFSSTLHNHSFSDLNTTPLMFGQVEREGSPPIAFLPKTEMRSGKSDGSSKNTGGKNNEEDITFL